LASSSYLRDVGLRRAAVSRLMFLAHANSLTADHIRTVAETFDVHPRTVRRWIDNANQHDGRYTVQRRTRLTLTQEMRDAVARWCGNIAAAHRELLKENRLGSKPPSYATFHRAVTDHYTPGFLAGLRGGEQERRTFDVHHTRDPGHRNEAWEADHVEASVWVNVRGHRRKPWITWFIDCACDAICGLCISAQFPSQENVLVAIRAALQRGGEYGPFGGLPGLIRIDGGKDFLCKSVEAALGVFSVRRVDLPPRHPELKGTVEALNGAIKKMLFPSLPGYTEAPRTSRSKRIDPDEHLLTYEAFVRIVLEWVHYWNYEHVLSKQKRTPYQLWSEDLIPIYDPDPADLHTFTLKLHDKPLTINADGVHWGPRRYLAPFMQGRAGDKVLVRYMPHHHREVELYKAKDETYLGPATLQNAATDEQKREVRRAAARQASRLSAALDRAERQRRERFEADITPTTPRPVSDLTSDQAEELLRGHQREDLAREARPDLTPLPEPSASWQDGDTTPPPDSTAADPPGTIHPPLPDPSPSWYQPGQDPAPTKESPDDHD
jgi:putative transposase